jgi:hypothetical protein
MSVNSVQQLVDAEINGAVRRYMWRKVPSQVTTAGYWFDLSLSPGNPVPKYWFDATPLIAKAIYQSTDGGIWHGPDTTPKNQYLRMTTAMSSSGTGLPLPLVLCDFLLYYPSIDDSVLDEQILDNTITLPRYTDGKGVQVIAVTVAGRTGGQSFYFNYTNSDGVAGRISQTVQQNAISAIGTITTSSRSTLLQSGNPFIGLQAGDSGVNKVIQGDCLEVMKNIPDKSIDMILCDLPYGTTACKWDTIIPFEPLWEQYKRIIKDNGAIVLNSEPTFYKCFGDE